MFWSLSPALRAFLGRPRSTGSRLRSAGFRRSGCPRRSDQAPRRSLDCRCRCFIPRICTWHRKMNVEAHACPAHHGYYGYHYGTHTCCFGKNTAKSLHQFSMELTHLHCLVYHLSIGGIHRFDKIVLSNNYILLLFLHLVLVSSYMHHTGTYFETL